MKVLKIFIVSKITSFLLFSSSLRYDDDLEPWQFYPNFSYPPFRFLKSTPFFKDLRKVKWHLKDFFFFNVALPVRPFWKDKVALSTNLNVHFMCIYVMCVCMSRYLARRQFSYAPMDLLPFALSPFSYPSLFSFFNRFFRRHRTASLSANSAEEAMWEFICPTSTTLVLLTPLVIYSYLPFFIHLVIYVLHS